MQSCAVAWIFPSTFFLLQGDVKTILTLEAAACAEKMIEKALEDLIESLPSGCVVSVAEEFDERQEK